MQSELQLGIRNLAATMQYFRANESLILFMLQDKKMINAYVEDVRERKLLTSAFCPAHLDAAVFVESECKRLVFLGVVGYCRQVAGHWSIGIDLKQCVDIEEARAIREKHSLEKAL